MGEFPVIIFPLLFVGLFVLLRGKRAAERRHGWSAPEPSWRLCPRLECGHLNRPTARFCAQCGCPLDDEGGMEP